MERLLTLDPLELILRFEVGKKSIGVLQLKNEANAPVAFKIQNSAPRKYIVKPPHAIIEPLGTGCVDIILTPQDDLPGTFPACPDTFTVKSVVVPMPYVSDNHCSSFSMDWFTAKKKGAVYIDTSLKIMLVGGGILKSLIAKGAMEDVRMILERDPAVANAADESGDRALQVAISKNKPELVQLLLLFKANLELQNKCGQTPLQKAAHAGDALITELLLANGANTEARNDAGWRALHYATVRGYDEVMKLLIDYGANIDAAVEDGRTAVHIAVAEGHLHCLKVLLERGCNVDAPNEEGGTALHLASARGHVAIVKLLLENGANTDVLNCSGKTPYDDAADSSQSLLYDMLFLGDSLRLSARQGELKDVKKYIKHGAIMEGEDQHGWTALHQAAFKGKINVVKFLLLKGADLSHQDEEGYTALHTAVESGQKDIVELLLQKGADINEKTRRGMTPLDVATNLQFSGIMRILIEAGGVESDLLDRSDLDSPGKCGLNRLKQRDLDVIPIQC